MVIEGVNLTTFSKLLKKLSFYRLYTLALFVLIIVMSILPVLVFFDVPGVVKVTFLIILGYFIDILLPVGCIMISDSISLSIRETAIEKSDFFCIGIKGIGSFLGPALISAMFPFGFWIQTCGLCVLLWYSKRIPVYFSAMATVPYKL